MRYNLNDYRYVSSLKYIYYINLVHNFYTQILREMLVVLFWSSVVNFENFMKLTKTIPECNFDDRFKTLHVFPVVLRHLLSFPLMLSTTPIC